MSDIEELQKIIETMDIPQMRRNLIPQNIMWLNRNLRINNSQHPDIEKAMTLIKKLS